MRCRTVRTLLELLHVLDLAGFPSPPIYCYYCLFCSVLILLGQFVFNKWKGLSSVPSLYPIPVVVVSPTGVNCDLIWRDLLNSYRAAFQNESLSISQRRGIITLIQKADGDLKELSNWRPISLLNIDYKILTKALAKRIEKYLSKLINSDQTGFVKGRYIGQNIRLLNDIMEYLDAK